MKKVLSIAMGLFLVATTNAAIVVYTDAASFSAAVGAHTLEDFNDATLEPGFTINSDHGYNLTTVPGKMWDRVSADHNWSTTIDFAPPISAFGGEWDLAGPGGPGEGIDLDITLVNGGTVVDAATISKYASGNFIGFTSTESFDDVLIQSDNVSGAWCETYTLDNMRFAAAVPEPTALVLIAMGLFGFVAVRRKQ